MKIYYTCATRKTHSTETIRVALRLVFLLICQLDYGLPILGKFWNEPLLLMRFTLLAELETGNTRAAGGSGDRLWCGGCGKS